MVGLIGKKLGMTQIFGEKGERIGVTVIEAGPCSVLAINEKSIKLGFDLAKENSLKAPIAGVYKKINIKPLKVMREVPRDTAKEYKIGEELKADIFKPGDFVDVTGTSIGKGFQGGVKRWHWAGGYETHGSTSHRRMGSTGSTTTPGRVLKGHNQAGHMGDARVTEQNMRVVKIDAENNLLLVEGAIPGCKNNYVLIRTAKKKKPVAAK